MRKRSGKPKKGQGEAPRRASPSREERSGRDWVQLIGEALLILLVIAVPVVINPHSRNICDVKDVVLGLGVAAGLGVWLVAGLARGRLTWVRSRLNLLVLIFAAWAAVSITYAQFRYVAISEFARLAANVGIYLLAVVTLRSLRQATRVMIAAALGSIPVSAYAFAQATGHDFISYTMKEITRVFSFLGNPTFLGGYLILLIPIAVALAWPLRPEGEGGGRWRWARTLVFSLLALAMLVSLLLSYTMSGLIGMIVGALIAALMALARGGRRVMRWAIPGLAAGALLAGGAGMLVYRHMPPTQQARVQKVLHFQDPYAKERELHWRTAYAIFRESPLVGRGYGNFRMVSLRKMAAEWYRQSPAQRQGLFAPAYAHNEYLQVLSGLGLVGGILFLALLAAALAAAVRLYWRGRETGWRRVGLAILIGYLAFLFQNFFGVTFRQTGPVTFFWLWLGMLVVANRGQKELTPAAETQPAAPERAKRDARRRKKRGEGQQRGAVGPVAEWRFHPLSAPGVAVAAVIGIGVFAILAWVVITPVQASLMVRASEHAAALSQKAEREGNAAARQGDKTTAEAKLQEALTWIQLSAAMAKRATELSPYSALAYYQLAYAEGKMGEYARVSEERRKRLENSVTASERALELMPGSGPMYYNLGVTYKELGKLDKAEAAFREAVRLSPTLFHHQAGLAEVLYDEGKLKEAETYARKAAKINPREPKIFLLLRDIHQQQGDIDQVIEDMRNAVRADPSDAKLKGQLAEFLLSTKRYQEAVGACKQWAAADPTSGQPYYALGFAQYQLKRYRAALGSFNRALALNPQLHRARLHRAYTLIRLGQVKKGTQELEWLALRVPNTEEGKEAQSVLREAAGRAAALQGGKRGRDKGKR